MPTYEYKCENCGLEFECEQSIKDEALNFCEKCDTNSLRRLIAGGTSFTLLGGGWYKDLYSSQKK